MFKRGANQSAALRRRAHGALRQRARFRPKNLTGGRDLGKPHPRSASSSASTSEWVAVPSKPANLHPKGRRRDCGAWEDTPYGDELPNSLWVLSDGSGALAWRRRMDFGTTTPDEQIRALLLR